jgi:hypothetical protein
MNARGMTIALTEPPPQYLALQVYSLSFDHIVVFGELAAPRSKKLPLFGRDNYTDRVVNI